MQIKYLDNKENNALSALKRYDVNRIFLYGSKSRGIM